MTQEHAFFFPGPAGDLFAVLHDGAAPARTPVMFCHPFGEEKLWTHRAFVSFARELATLGHPVLRFDYAGNGDSDGDFSAASLDGAVADALAAADMLAARLDSPRLAVMGMRFGAIVAARVAARRENVSELMLWQPVVNGDKYLQELLRINVSTQMAVYREVRTDREEMVKVLAAGGTVNVDGYEVSPAMGTQLKAARLEQDIDEAGARCLIVQLDRAEGARPQPDLVALQERAPSGTALTLVREEPFWKEIPQLYERAPRLFEATLRWLEQ